MSRGLVGEVYGKVINEVCKQSRSDFEDGGVDESVLDLMRTNWQQKLSSLKVAQLPWDPPPPTPAIPSNATLPSNAKAVPQPLPSNGNPTSTPPSSHSTPGPQMKQEPGVFPSQPAVPAAYQMPIQYPPGMQLNARQRAAVNLQQAYGAQAGPQISQLQQGSMPRMPMPQQMNLVKQEDQKSTLSGLPDYSPNMQQPNLAPIKSSQNDGAADSLTAWKDEYARRKEAAARNGAEANRMMREQFMETKSRMEGGGLMLPLDEHYPHGRGIKRKVTAGHETSVAGAASSSPLPTSSLTRAQGDAAGDDEDTPEADEDAINSDLDDPDDRIGDVENPENTEHVMLCTYDKVQRVKNKWKCTLKDGILRVDGSEYVFHKGQGEFEW